VKVNWCKLVNRADGISEIEGKGRRGDRASRAGASFKFVSALVSSPWCEFVKFVSKKRLRKKISIQMITLIALSRLIEMKAKQQTKERNNNEPTDSVE
jgi:hypothetical protein